MPAGPVETEEEFWGVFRPSSEALGWSFSMRQACAAANGHVPTCGWERLLCSSRTRNKNLEKNFKGENFMNTREGLHIGF